MSLRLRLVLTIGIALAVLWGVAAVWMLRDLDRNLQQTLDDRLAMSARMVSGLLAEGSAVGSSPMSARDAVTVPGSRGMACQVRSLRGEVIATTHGASGAVMTSGGPGYRTHAVDGTSWRTYTLEANGYSITTADSQGERGELSRRIALAAGLPFLIAAMGGLLALWLGTGRALAPLARLRSLLEQRRPDAGEPLDVPPMPSELQPLVESINHLLHRVADAVVRERSFTNHAAHELRTPLTGIDTHLQVARLTEGEDARRALSDAGEGVQRMRATLDQLLMLARVEGRLRFDDGQWITAAQVLERVVSASSAEAIGRIVVDAGTGGTAVLAVPPALAVAALRNLVDNALRYSPAGSPVAVEVDSDPDWVRFRVTDRGAGLQPDELQQATRRFWRGRAGGGSGGSGLGLSIVDAIAKRHGGHVTLCPGEGSGTVAELVLPRHADRS